MTIGLDEVIADITAICEAKPNQRNPQTPLGACLYTHDYIPQWHCIAAEWMEYRGFDAPANEGPISAVLDLHRPDVKLTRDAKHFMRQLQIHADGSADGFVAGPIAWGELPKRIPQILSEIGVKQ